MENMGAECDKDGCGTPALSSKPQSSTPPSVLLRGDEEAQPHQIDVEVLGRQRPAVFKTIWAELGFCFSLVGSMLMAEFFVSGFHIILPPLSQALSIPPESQTWPSSVFSLVTGSCLLPLGRLGDMYGGYVTFNAGLIWFGIWALAAGFSQNYIMLVCFRALQGLGCAAFLPAGIMLLGKTYRPGPRKNLIFGIYGAFAPIGFFFGILIGGASGQFLSWRWYFWIGAMVIAIITATSLLTIPRDYRGANTAGARMDWPGTLTIVPGLVLVVYALTDSSSAPNGWKSPYIIATLILGVLFLCAAVYLQGWVCSNPLLPADLFRPKYMKRMVFSLFLVYGAFGVWLFYSSFYIELVMKQAPLTTAVWYVPQVVGGLLIGSVGGATLHHFSGRVLFIISGVGHVLCSLLFAIMPAGSTYWPYVFPAMICSTIGIDVTYTVSNVFITTQLPAHHQGLAGAVINSVLFLGISFWLGIADIAVGKTASRGLMESYRVAFWLAVALPVVASIFFVFMKIGYAKSDFTHEEREQMEARERGDGASGGELADEDAVETSEVQRQVMRASRASRRSSQIDRQITIHP
ncbi:related to multidrug resistance protein [Cephalotrichum gorgonifer]|uniref:Related to multidrug resistance protein n=1 Tax=Cephalotrichum gorgonifer TaxID=2041049 RepID=A0AAE8N478_9PEZI|nr:related to multidrug resistance protein [Cephalotrichum gorgonifer]